MENKKTALILLCAALAALLGGGAYLYQTFSGEYANSNLVPPAAQEEGPVADTQEGPAAEGEDSAEKKPIPAPDFVVYNADGEEVSPSDYLGKYLVINFWASWCGPCKSEMPAFNAVIGQYKDNEDIAFLMVNMTDGQRETQESAQALVEENGWEMDILFDTDFSAATNYNVYGLPTTVLVDKEGYLLAIQPSAISQEILESAVETMLADEWERPLV